MFVSAVVAIAGLVAAVLIPVSKTSASLLSLFQPRKSNDLKERLKTQLRPRSPREFAFLDRVVEMVDEDELPNWLVDATFNWARKKHRRYRFPHFQRALQIEAAKRGIRIQ
jgi:hypothetical protein